MAADLILEHRSVVTALLAALATFGTILFVAWPHVALNGLSRRLHERIAGRNPHRAQQGRPPGEMQPAKGLRDKQPRLPARLLSAFRIVGRLNEGRLRQALQQAGYRGRGAALRYIALRTVSPLAALGAAGFYILVLVPEMQLYVRGAILIASAVFGWFLPPILLRNRIAKRRVEIGRAWPDAVDLMLICCEAGMSIEHAFRKVAEETAGTSIELAKETSLTNAELSYLRERRQAYENLAHRVEIDGVRAVTSALIQSERYGTPLGHSLRVVAEENRAMRMAAAEKKAAALPPKLTVPMIIFFLPVLFAVIITPAVLRIMGV